MQISAGIVMYRVEGSKLSILLAHPGGPFFAKKDHGAWTIPKGAVEHDESLEDAAKREFEEEIGVHLEGAIVPLGSIRQRSGKIVHAWAWEAPDGWSESSFVCSTRFTMEWPPRSGRKSDFPEVDRIAFFEVDEAKIRIIHEQAHFLSRLAQILGDTVGRENA